MKIIAENVKKNFAGWTTQKYLTRDNIADENSNKK